MKGLATVSATVAIALGAAIPAGAQVPTPKGCEQLGNFALAARGFDSGVAAVDRHGDAARFIRVPRNNMLRCMYVDYNAGVAFARGTRGLPLSATWARTPYIGQAYVAGLSQRKDR